MHSKETLKVLAISAPIVLVLSILLYFCLRNKSQRVRKIPFIFIAVICLGFEIAKQVYAIKIGYTNKFMLPFHVSSVPIYAYCFATFLNQKWKITRIFWALAVVVSFAISFPVLIAPQPIFSEQLKRLFEGTGTILDLHSVVVHYFFVFFTVLVFLLKPYKPKVWELLLGGVVFMLMVIGIWTAANVFNANFANFLKFWFPIFDTIKESNFRLFQFYIFLMYVGTYLLCSIIVYFALKLRIKDTVLDKVATESPQSQAVH
jgi:hypothetical protein